MDSAKSAVKDFLHKSGKHDTTVHEDFAPAVTNETVTQHRHENVTTALDKEVHQDHYHTTVQPVHDKQKLAEQHHHNLGAVEHRKFEHGNDDEVQRRLETERAKFNDSSVKGETRHTSSAAPIVAGEHVHHHIHENIQPVINRETIEPHVVHTTVPIHETHHNAAQHHSTTALPAVSMADFKKQGGVLQGREQRTDFFEGEPRNMTSHAPNRPEDESSKFRNTGHVDQHGLGKSSTTGTGTSGAGLNDNTTRGSHHHHGANAGTGSGLNNNSTTGTGTGLNNSSTTGTGTGTSGLTGSNTTGSSGLRGERDASNLSGTSSSHDRVDSVGGANDSTTAKTKPSLLQRLNPMKDTDGDGKRGVMD